LFRGAVVGALAEYIFGPRVYSDEERVHRFGIVCQESRVYRRLSRPYYTRSACNIVFENSASCGARDTFAPFRRRGTEKNADTPTPSFFRRRRHVARSNLLRRANAGQRCFPPFISLSSLLHSSPCHFRRIACHETSQAAPRDERVLISSLFCETATGCPNEIKTASRQVDGRAKPFLTDPADPQVGFEKLERTRSP